MIKFVGVLFFLIEFVGVLFFLVFPSVFPLGVLFFLCTSEDNCTNLNDGTRIYAGGSWEMPLPEGSAPGQGYIQYGMFDGEFEEAQRFRL
ncbi:hypothetical protein J7438_10910 [Thalassotalea sp. G20_0]|uniref:hypothetical protein n=1 Tax=Thalassotalea sp. G20_0 TaxID=2821093 RepID=UPI001ADA2871|nr:hypothetical protein [Thalassotalea sp. G20_0]MBO9494596.1 hypothetical protein [Thalassotalea sp. G20_0]